MTGTLADLAWPLRTERLRIRRATPDDADRVWAYRRLDAVSQWLSGAAADRSAHADQFAEPVRMAATLIVERDGPAGAVLVGDLKLAIENGWAQREVAEQAVAAQAELGWALSPEEQGKGYATEAVTALLEIAFGALGLRRVVAYCFADNRPSWRLMERVGMRREGHSVADSLHRSGRWLDGLVYAMLADEWRARH